MINDLHAQNELTEKTAKFLANLRARTKNKKKTGNSDWAGFRFVWLCEQRSVY